MGGSDVIKAKFAERVIKEGYNMIIDDHGTDFAGNGQRVNAPLIVLNANNLLKQIGSKKYQNMMREQLLINTNEILAVYQARCLRSTLCLT